MFSLVPNTIFVFFGSYGLYNKDDPCWKQFENDLVLFIAKELVPLSFVEAPTFRRLVPRENALFNFPLR
jgi:hypothetical protein